MQAKSIRVVLLSTIILVGAQAAAFAERFTERIEKTFQVDSDVSITLGNTNGNVSISIWDQDSVQMVAEKQANSRNAEAAREAFEALEITIDASANHIEIETVLPKGGDGFFERIFGNSSTNASVRYQLKVPRQAALTVRTVNGNVTTEGSQGSQKLRSTNGRIEVEGATQQVAAHTTNGSIRVGVRSTSAPEIELGTTNGSITLELPADARGSVEARTVNGSIKTEVPITHGSASRKRIKGDFNGEGGGSIELRTTNGSIRIVEA
jgi:DUF4097 and DUF4098 domain-containing protein YvlB